jgi:biopolymer transport protein ExbB
MKFIVYLLAALTFPALAGAQDEAAAVGSRAAGIGGEGMTLWRLIETGGWAMIPLAILSILAVMLIIAYLFTMRRSAVLTHQYMNTADVLLKKGDYPGLVAISSRHGEAIARVVQRTLDFAIKNPTSSIETLREIAETEASGRAASLQHRVIYLADIGVLAPMVGLFGTVLGIIKSFGVMANQSQQAPRAVLLAAGVSEALVATAAGLILGILAMGCYALFRGRVQRLISDLDIATSHLMGILSLRWKRKPGRVSETETADSILDEGF